MEKKLNTKEFVERSKIIHNNLYDYSRAEYIGSKINIEIGCDIHGWFKQRADTHLNGSGCSKCTKKILDVNIFIDKANIVHNNKWDYSKIEYINVKTKVIIGCDKHGWFEQTPRNHLYKKQGCSRCVGINRNKSNIGFIKEANIVHNNKWDYSKTNYENSYKKVIIGCSIHGDFEQIPDNHLSKKHGCPKCVGKNKTNIDFIKESNIIHSNKWNYSKIEYINNITKIIIGCDNHGWFKQRPDIHLRGGGCQKCKSSKGEKKIRNYLKENNISFKEQHKFEDCKYKNKLLFDFYLPEHNTCIEYDGIQHFKIIEHFGGRSAFMKLKHRDKIKNKYCIDNNMKLIRIPYTEFDNIGEYIVDIFQKSSF